jgi:ABC-type methionine transport system permease subunit
MEWIISCVHSGLNDVTQSVHSVRFHFFCWYPCNCVVPQSQLSGRNSVSFVDIIWSYINPLAGFPFVVLLILLTFNQTVVGHTLGLVL